MESVIKSKHYEAAHLHLPYSITIFTDSVWIFSILFYVVLNWNVLRNVDEVLHNRKINLLAYLEVNPKAPFQGDNPLDDFTFYAINIATFQKGKETYTDTLVYEPVDDELDEYRKLTTFVEIHNQHYRLEIIAPHLEAAEMIGTIAFFGNIAYWVISLLLFIATNHFTNNLEAFL